jgi:hypothetical protein
VKPGDKPGDKPVPWWDGPKIPDACRAVSSRWTACPPNRRLIIELVDRKTVKLLVYDPGVVYTGEGEFTLGAAFKPRRV